MSWDDHSGDMLKEHDAKGYRMKPCSKCKGKGYYEAYMGGMSDHDPVRVACSACRVGTELKPGEVHWTAPVATPDADIASTLRTRSGAAYAAGDDARAIRLRNAADLVEGKVTGPYSLEPNGPVSG